MSVEIYTLGCRLNAAESEEMRRLASCGGGDQVIINSCAVTREAMRQSRQMARRAKRKHQNAEIVVTGCAADIAPDMFLAMPEVDRLIPNGEKLNPAFLKSPASPQKSSAEKSASLATRRVRAPLRVQNGCDHQCTFCIIPKGRGAAQSRPPQEIIRHARQLLQEGAREIILTGVDLTSYHYGAMRLGDMARALLQNLPELPRLRLSSLDPAAFDPALFQLIAEEPRLQPHLHLSMQAGHDIILKRMRRRHLTQDFLELCRRLRALRPDMALGADIIAGFPTETEDMFQATRALLQRCAIAKLHVFPFSAHPQTPAAKMPQLPKPLIQKRARILREDAERAERRHLQQLDGARKPCLMETPHQGRTPCHTLIHSEMPRAVGAIRDFHLSLEKTQLVGRRAPERSGKTSSSKSVLVSGP